MRAPLSLLLSLVLAAGPAAAAGNVKTPTTRTGSNTGQAGTSVVGTVAPVALNVPSLGLAPGALSAPTLAPRTDLVPALPALALPLSAPTPPSLAAPNDAPKAPGNRPGEVNGLVVPAGATFGPPERLTGAPEKLAVTGEAAAGANALSRGLFAPGGRDMGTELSARFDGLEARSGVLDAPVTSAGLQNSPQGARVAVAPAEADRLARLGAQAQSLRAQRAAQGEASLAPEDAAMLRGIDDLSRMVALGDSTPQQIAAAVAVVERMDVATLRRFSEAAKRFINTDVKDKSTPFARVGNVEHVEQQLIEPLVEDGAELARAYKTNPRQSVEHFVEMLRALQYATDTGKQQNPEDMGKALARFNSQADTGANWYINNFILPHEYASMGWVETLGKEAGMSPRETLAFQRLIANHNFGPDLTDKKNAAMREHWWPKSFRTNTLPMLKAMGIDVVKHFEADETGTLQYGHALKHPITMLLSVYDRAIAVSASAHRTGNGSGLATWKKYGIQDFNGKKGRLTGVRKRNAQAKPGALLESDPLGAKDEDGKAGAIFEFDGPSVIKAMESAADWSEQHIMSLWGSLYDALPADSALRKEPGRSRWGMFEPFLAQRRAVGFLNGLLRVVKDSNPEGPTNRADVLPGAGVAYYEARSQEFAGIYRVSLERTGPGAFDPRSADFGYAAKISRWKDGGWKDVPAGGRFAPSQALAGAVAGQVALSGVDPVALYIDLIRADQEALTAENASPRGPPNSNNIFKPAPAPAPAGPSATAIRDLAAVNRHIRSIASGVSLTDRQRAALLEQWLEEKNIPSDSPRARELQSLLLPKAAAADDAAMKGVAPELQGQRAALLKLARENGTTPAAISDLLASRGLIGDLRGLDSATFERQGWLALRRASLENAVRRYPDNEQGAFMRQLASDMASPGGKSVEEVARAGVFAYVDFSGAGVSKAFSSRDPDLKTSQMAFYVTRREEKWRVDGYRQNRPLGRSDAELIKAFKAWLVRGGIPPADFE